MLTWRRALALWLALLALTVQAFTPLAHARALERFATGPVNGFVVVCSADGLKLVNLDALIAADAGDGKAVGFHLPFDVQAKAGKHACCLAAGVPALAPEPTEILPPARIANATAPPRAQGPQHVDRAPARRPGHPRDPPLTVA
ncbi:hypothetical protein FHP25_28200 [Vineibacter terrae]|uniref:DUF2946 domain-containing protein n=1 Tax=Vineibacter terrae TaxID=2586908 RepID=A0A5C8PF18_9HYPH|nr:DUF2946 family protein [Vineibacter terrae]TXL71923.1 hypothetical protein FHP25_28200 [Vineibacter terrae]